MISGLAGFDDALLHVGEVSIRTRTAGDGPGLLLLHGYPESSIMWRHVAGELARDFSVVATDLRGYGSSSAPPDDAEHLTYSKRAMAVDQVAVMEALGHSTFAVAGHDRGGRVAHRLTLDYPTQVTRVAVLDIVPTLHMYENVDLAMAQTYFHWFFLTQPGDMPERLINANPEAWIAARFRGRHRGEAGIEEEAIAEYTAAFRDPARVAATCADYRAAATIDLMHDREDRTVGNRIEAPLLAMWGATSYVGRNFDVVRAWREFATSVTGVCLPSDHYLPEEAPELTTEALRDFFLDRA